MPELEFTESELEAVTTVFKQYETGLREACIDVKDLLPALVSLGLNMMEQEVIDMTNTVARNGLVFFPEFCAVVLRKFREEDEEQFSQIMFKMLCGTEPFPELYRAKKYKIHQKFLTKTDFQFIMRNLPVKVTDAEIDEMFHVADVDNDGKIGYKDFQKMVNPPKPPEKPKPTKAQFRHQFQIQSEDNLRGYCSQGAPPPPRPQPSPAPSPDQDSCSVDVNASYSDPLLCYNLSA